MKRCGRCKLMMPLGEFRRRTASRDGLQGYCRACANACSKKSKSAVKVDSSPALMVIQQLALEWGSERDAAKVLALRDGSNWQAWEREIERWRESGTMTEEAADRFACATGRHVEELWGRERGAA